MEYYLYLNQGLGSPLHDNHHLLLPPTFFKTKYTFLLLLLSNSEFHSPLGKKETLLLIFHIYELKAREIR